MRLVVCVNKTNPRNIDGKTQIFAMAASSSISTGEEQPPQYEVFISFRGADLRRRFVSHLVTAMKSKNIKVFIDDYEDKGQPLEILLQRIEESKIALAIFSGKYTDSIWCVRELAKIKACMDEGTLIAIPIFFKVEPSTVRGLTGSFGDKFRSLAEAFKTIPNITGVTVVKERYRNFPSE